jgi:hypothetical protein
VGKCGRCVGLTTLPPSCAVVKKYGNLNFLEPSGPLQACNGTALPFILIYHHHYHVPEGLDVFPVPIYINNGIKAVKILKNNIFLRLRISLRIRISAVQVNIHIQNL